MSFINKISLLTILFALITIFIVIILNTADASMTSAIFAWITVITTQLSLISVRIKNDKSL
jgi:hypothetical protein